MCADVRRAWDLASVRVARVLLGEVGEVEIERAQHSHDGRPADAAVAVLKLGEVGGVHAGPLAELLLSESCSLALRAECCAEDRLIAGGGVIGGVCHQSRPYIATL
jgi:hypothetical protein